MKNFSFYIEALGCPMRAVEAQRVKLYFKANGGIETLPTESDIIVFSTCSIISDSENQSLRYLKTLISFNKRIILLGCSPGMSKIKIQQIFNGEMLATRDLEKIDVFFPEFEVKFDQIGLPTECLSNFGYTDLYLKDFLKYLPITHKIKKIKPQLIVTSKGCNNACSYCSVRKALGPLQSYKWNEIIERYENSISKGFKVFIFNGDDTGAFYDSEGRSFKDLLLYLDVLPGNNNISWIIDNLHPQWFLKYYDCFEYLSKKKRIREIVLPIQAATDILLSSMRRKHSITDIESKLCTIKKIAPKLSIRTHFIIGYPGETKEDLKQLKQLIDKKYFSYIVVLRYHEAGGSISEKMDDKIESFVIEERVQDIVNYIKNKKIKYELTG